MPRQKSLGIFFPGESLLDKVVFVHSKPFAFSLEMEFHFSHKLLLGKMLKVPSSQRGCFLNWSVIFLLFLTWDLEATTSVISARLKLILNISLGFFEQ